MLRPERRITRTACSTTMTSSISRMSASFRNLQGASAASAVAPAVAPASAAAA